MTRRSAAALVAVAALVAGCGKTSERYYGTTSRHGREPTTFYVNNGQEPEYIDPTLTSESGGAFIVAQLFEGLVQQHPDTLAPIPGVADRYDQSEDNRIFRFHLRHDAKWSDGKPVVAADFAYAWRRALTPATGARMAELLYNLKNGRGFHQGSLRVLNEGTPLSPSGKLKGGTALPRGQAVEVLLRLPATSDRLPQPEPQPKVQRDALKAHASLSSPAAVEVLEVGPAGECNGLDDRWFKVKVGGVQGYLPGCAMQSGKTPSAAVVQRYDDLPLYGASSETKEEEEAPVGFVPHAALMADSTVVGVRVVDDHTLEVELEKPTPFFLELLAYATFLPVRKDVIDRFDAEGRLDEWTRPGNIVSNGPYQLTEHKFRYEMTLEKNPHHYRANAIKIDRVVVMEVGSYLATMNLYKTGEIDFIGQNLTLPQEFLPRLGGFEDFHQTMWNATYWYEFNTAQKPVDDVRVRHALDLSVDKKALVERVTKGGQVPATHFVPDFVGGGYAAQSKEEREADGGRFDGAGHDFDPARARGLLKEAGYEVVKDGDRFRAKGFPDLEILYNTSEGHRAIAVALQGMWKQHLGISVTLRNEEWKVMIKNLRDGRFQLARFGWVGDYNHPHSWLETFASYSNNNWTGWQDSRFDQVLAEAAATKDPAASMSKYRDAEAKLVEAMPRLPLYFYTKSTLIKPYVRGYYTNAANRHNICWMWIDPDFDPERGPAENRPAMDPGAFPPPGSI